MTGAIDRHVDTVIVGGGIIGLAAAFELAERGQRVTVLEAHRIGERAAAGVAAGMLAPRAEADLSHPELTRLALASHELFPRFAERVESASNLSVGYDRGGTYFVALTRDDRARIEHLETFLRERGLASGWLTGRELREAEPALAPGVGGALHLPDDHQVDPRRLLAALTAGIRNLGGEVCEEARTLRVAPSAGGVDVHYDLAGDERMLSAASVIIAGGAWTNAIEGLPIDLPLRPVKGQVVRLRGERLIHRVIRTPEVYIVPRGDGELVIGASMEEQGFDDRVMAGPVRYLLQEARRVLPGIDELELAECNAGFRPALRDHLPAIGRTPMPGLFVATGHFRNGVELAPVTARLLADLILCDRADPLLAPFDPMRFAATGAADA